MFRDLKEYQELQKLYESKVSKPEQLDEFTGLGVKKAVQMSKPKPKPVLTQKDQSDIKKEAGLQKVLNNKKNLQKIETKAAADKKEVDFRLKNTESSEQSAKAEARPKRRRVGSPMDELNPGAARVKARFKAREAKGLSGLTGKPKGQPQLSGKERAQAMAKARIAAKNKASQPKPETKSGSGVSFGDAIKLNTPKQQDTATLTKTKPTYQSNRDKQNRLRQNQRQNQKPNPTTGKIIPKPNTGTDTEQKSNKIIPKPNTGTDTENKSGKIIPKRNTGTDTEKKKSKSENPKIKDFNNRVKDIKTRAKYGSTATIETQDGKSFKPGDPGYEAELKKARELMRKSMREAYASIYNQPAEPENIDETRIDEGATAALGVGAKTLPKIPGALKAIGAGAATGAGALKLKNVFKSTRVKGSAIPDKDDEFIRSSDDEPHFGDIDPRKETKGASKADSGQGEIKIGKVTITKKDPKTGKIIKKQKRDKRSEIMGQGSRTGGNYVGDHYEYEPYDLVLEYLLSTEQVATIEEANYVMTEMDAETIQDIVAEGIGQLKILPTLVKGAAAVYGVKKGAEFLGRKKGESDIKPKKKFDPIGNARKKYQDKKATEYEKKSGTTKEDGYFR